MDQYYRGSACRLYRWLRASLRLLAYITRHRGWHRDEMAEMRDFVVMILISKHKNSSSNHLIECNVVLAWARRGREHVGGNTRADYADAQNHIIIIANLEVSHGARSQKERLGSVSAQLRCMLCAYIAGRIVDRAELDGGSRHVHTRQRKSKEGFLATFFLSFHEATTSCPIIRSSSHRLALISVCRPALGGSQYRMCSKAHAPYIHTWTWHSRPQ